MADYLKVPIGSILVKPDRARKEFRDIMGMGESLKRNGFINPLLVTPNPDKEGSYILIAGERRFRGACVANITEVPVTFRENCSPLEQKILELEENVGRQGLSWDEECELSRQIDELKQQSTPGWTQKDSAKLLDLSPAHVSLQIKMAQKLKADPSLRKEVAHLPINAAMKVIENKEKVQRVDRLQKAGRLEITTDLRLGDCRQLIKQLNTGSVDLLVTDPPYGLEKLEALREGSGGSMSGHQLMSEHHNSDIVSVIQLLRDMAPELVRVLKPGAHWYVFCAFQYIGETIEALKPLMFQPPVVVWDRGKGTSPGYGYNYINRLEVIVYGHNIPRSKRLNHNKYNVLEHPEVPKNLRVYPTEKPQALLREIIEMSSNVGDTVLDICAGSGSTLKAARGLGRKSIGFEINPDSWKQTQLELSGQKEDGERGDTLLVSTEELKKMAKSSILKEVRG